MINKYGFSNVGVKFVNIKTSPNVARLMGSSEQIISPQDTGSGDSIKVGNRYQY
jgi:hypothetical protein